MLITIGLKLRLRELLQDTKRPFAYKPVCVFIAVILKDCFANLLTRASVQVTGVIILYLRFVTVELNADP